MFSESVVNFSSDTDILFDTNNGTLPTMTSSDQITWISTFTPTIDLEFVGSNEFKLTTEYTDNAGNIGLAATTSNFEIDTKYPTVTKFTVSDTSLQAGDTAVVSLVFSESVANFSSDTDILFDTNNGNLSTMTSSNQITWVSTFTPTVDLEFVGSNELKLTTDYTDNAGNIGPAATTSNLSLIHI